MEKLGAEYSYERSDKENNIYKLSKINIEIHSGIAFGENLSGKYDYYNYFKDAFENAEQCEEYTYEMTPQFNLIYVLYHTAKHCYKNGCGVRMITDIAVMVQVYKDIIHWDDLFKELEKIGLNKFADKIFSLCNRWFGTEIPLAGYEYDFSDIEIVENNILTGGVYGYKNVDKDTGVIMKNKSKYYILSIVKWAFPSYKKMREHSDWFKDKPAILLPVAYVERFIRNARERGGVMKWLKAIKKGKKKRDSHNNILEIMGLE